MSAAEMIAPLLGRILIAWFFLSESLRYGESWRDTLQHMAEKHIPNPEVSLFFALLAALLGSFSLLLGFRTKLGAIVLFFVIIASSLKWHDYWTVSDAAERLVEYQLFARNLAIAGGLLTLIGIGSGHFAMDNKKPSKGGGKH